MTAKTSLILRVLSAAVAGAAPLLANAFPAYAWLFSAIALAAGGTAFKKAEP